MLRKPQKGYLVLADISGFTSFVAKTEIDHAEKAISILLEKVIQKLDAMVTIVELEGGAIFAHVPEDRMPDCNAMLGLMDDTYRIFRDSARELHAQATCPCKACLAIPSLDLKFIVHHGEYIVHHVAGIRRLMGNDVTLIHRLAKNQVSETMGWKGYILFTGKCLENLQADKKPFVQQAESYEHLGDVDTYVMDMHVRYDEKKQ